METFFEGKLAGISFNGDHDGSRSRRINKPQESYAIRKGVGLSIGDKVVIELESRAYDYPVKSLHIYEYIVSTYDDVCDRLLFAKYSVKLIEVPTNPFSSSE